MKTDRPKMTPEQLAALIAAFDRTIDRWNAMPDDIKEKVTKPMTPKDYVFNPLTPIRPKRVTLRERLQQNYAKYLTLHTDHLALRKANEEMSAEIKRLCGVIDSNRARLEEVKKDYVRDISDQKQYIARLKGCLDRERDAYARLAKRLHRMRDRFPRAMESIENTINEEENRPANDD